MSRRCKYQCIPSACFNHNNHKEQNVKALEDYVESKGIFPVAEKLLRRTAVRRIVLQAYPEAATIEMKDNKDKGCATPMLAHTLQEETA